MIELKLRKPALDVEDQYEGKGMQFSASEAMSLLARSFDVTITTKIVKRSGPVYYGELERLVLDPLVQVSLEYLKQKRGRRNPDTIINAMLARAVAYGVIDQTIKVFEVREVAKSLTDPMLRTSDIFNTLTSLSPTVDTTVAEPEGSNGGAAGAEVTADSRDKTPSSLRLIREWLSGEVVKASSNKPLDTPEGLSVIAGLIQAACFGADGAKGYETYKDSISSIYDTLLRYAKRGKGMALSTPGRASVLQKVSIVRACVSALFTDGQSGADAGDPGVLRFGSAGVSMALALMSYMAMAADPDAYFPKQELQFNVQAWAGGLKAETSELKQFWMYLAMAPSSFTIELGDCLWQEELDWLKFLGPEFEVLRQARESLDSARQRFDLVRSDLCRDLAHKIMDDVKKRSGATKILPKNFMQSDLFQRAMTEVTDRVKNPEVVWRFDGSNDRSSPTKMFEIPLEGKLRTSEYCAQQAQSLIDAYDVIVRALQLISLEADNVQPLRPLVDISITDLLWQDVSPISGHEILTFEEPEPTSAAVAQWAGSPWPTKTAEIAAFSPTWRREEYLYTPFRPMRALWKEISSTPALFMWNRSDLPEVLGDAITRPWGHQPIPACYTYSRNRSIRPYTMREYLLSMDGVLDGTPWDKYLVHAAELIALYGPEDALAKAVVNYLAPVMSVADSRTKSIIMPTLKTLYGVPTQKFIEKQGKPLFTAGELTNARKSDLVHLVNMTDETGEDYVLSFQLHAKFPPAAPVTIFLQSLDTGLSLPAPITRTTADAYFSQLDDKMIASLKEFSGDAMLDAIASQWSDNDMPGQWVLPGGFAPFTCWMPATYFSVFQRASELRSEDKRSDVMYALAAALKWKVSPVTGALQIRGFVHDPVCILDETDRIAAISQKDPVPCERTLLPPEAVYTGQEAPASVVKPAPDPAGVVPESKEKKISAGVATAGVSAPVDLAHSDGTIKVTIESSKADNNLHDSSRPMTGDPGQDGELVWIVVEEEERGKKLKKVKKSEVPSGARLASEDEIAEWVKSNGEAHEVE